MEHVLELGDDCFRVVAVENGHLYRIWAPAVGNSIVWGSGLAQKDSIRKITTQSTKSEQKTREQTQETLRYADDVAVLATEKLTVVI